MDAMRRFSLILLGLLILGGVAFLLAVRLHRWPKLQAGFVRLGDAAVTFAIGLVGYVLVVLVFRALGWLPSSN